MNDGAGNFTSAGTFGANYAPTRNLTVVDIDKDGDIDILINNAGIQHVAPIDTFPVEKWDEIIAINLSAAFHTSAVALGAMRKAVLTRQRRALGRPACVRGG